MTSLAAIPSQLPVNKKQGAILTFIVPAPNGCNLACPYCFIDQRKENAISNDLRPEEYTEFIRQISQNEAVDAVCIQGYEPFLPESAPYTEAILKSGAELQIPTSVVTNGTYLSQNLRMLREAAPWKICVSLDASSAVDHNRQRGREGAFESALFGLKEAVAFLPKTTEIAVASVLIPKKRYLLDDMPSLLVELGVKTWIVTALHKIKNQSLSEAPNDKALIFKSLLHLKKEADAHQIEFFVDDEFSSLELGETEQRFVDINAMRIRRLKRPSGVFRLLPTGQCSMGMDILRAARTDAPRWHPTMLSATEFLANVRADYASRAPITKSLKN